MCGAQQRTGLFVVTEDEVEGVHHSIEEHQLPVLGLALCDLAGMERKRERKKEKERGILKISSGNERCNNLECAYKGKRDTHKHTLT